MLTRPDTTSIVARVVEQWPSGVTKVVGEQRFVSESAFWNGANAVDRYNGCGKSGGDFFVTVAPSPATLASSRYQRALTDESVRTGGFTARRDYPRYRAYFATMLDRCVAALGDGDRVLDGGGEGSAFSQLASDRPTIDFRAVAAHPGNPGLLRGWTNEATSLPKERITYGLLGTRRAATEKALGLGTYKLIVDVMGAFHYAKPDVILASYGRLLAPGGKLLLHIPRDAGSFVIAGEPDNRRALAYLERCSGLKVRSVRRPRPTKHTGGRSRSSAPTVRSYCRHCDSRRTCTALRRCGHTPRSRRAHERLDAASFWTRPKRADRRA